MSVDRIAALMEGAGNSETIQFVAEETPLMVGGLECLADVLYQCDVVWRVDPADGSVYDIEPYNIQVVNLGAFDPGSKQFRPQVWADDWQPVGPEHVQAAAQSFDSEMPEFTRAALRAIAGSGFPGNEVGNSF